ncbi:MAG TPA: cytochrome P450 [Rubrobacter sp.]|nr:cytochrome P450 [Rubrobacter sp.]
MRKMFALVALASSVGAALIGRILAKDRTLALLSEGYAFIPERCRRHETDVFETRIMLTKAICMMGEEAVRVFYEPERFTRVGALPQTTLRLLQDKGSVALLDGEAHRRRKEMFLSLADPGGSERTADAMEGQWRARIGRWESMDKVVLLREVEEIFCRAACEWAGVPLTESEAGRRTREFSAMIEGAGSIGPRNWYGQLLRARTERWMKSLIEKVRAGELDVPERSAAHIIAWHRGLDGGLLDTEIAAVELINVLRPTVAVARFVTFAALALHEHPECRHKIQEDEDYLDPFVQEVRRFYPLFPFVGGRVRDEFEWRGRHFAEGTWVLLDLYGTNHDARTWDDPEAFRPERFSSWDGSAFDFVPQGGGDHRSGHRCPGEWATIALIKRAVRLLTRSMSYDVPEQDLRISLSRMPTIPKSRFVISGVRRTR